MFKIGTKRIQIQLREDRAVLMVCIGVAFVFWLLVKLSQTYTTEKEVVFQFDVPDEKALTLLPPDDVKVQLEGRGWDLMFDYFSKSKVYLLFDMQEENRIRLNWLQLRSLIQRNLSSTEIKITEINYDNLSLNLEDKMKKKIPLKLQTRLAFEPQYQLKDAIQIEPDSLIITGPKSLVENIESWNTDSLILLNLKAPKKVKLQPETPPREIQLNIKELEADLPIEQFTEKSLFVPILAKNAVDSIRIFPERIKIYCVVGLSKYGEVNESDFKVEVDLKEAKVGVEQNTIPIELRAYPSFVQNVRFSPKAVEYLFVKQIESDTIVKTPSPQR